MAIYNVPTKYKAAPGVDFVKCAKMSHGYNYILPNFLWGPSHRTTDNQIFMGISA